MKYALVNPQWTFEGSTYFGCREPHVPLELLSAREMLRAAGHHVLLIDANMEELAPADVRSKLEAFGEDFLVIPTAPSYLFWRCPQPELRVPKVWIGSLARESKVVLIGPHGSATPHATMMKTGADVVLRGEPDQTLPQLSSVPWEMVPGCCWRDEEGRFRVSEGLGTTDMKAVTMLDYSDYPVERHTHLHHVFAGNGADHLKLGAEVEFARGCPYSCTFCNKTLFRNQFRERDLSQVLQEIDQLIARGVDYVYFIDEIFGVGKQVRVLLEEIAKRPLAIGFQTRIDLWNEESLELLGRAHCVSFECGIESITHEGREEFNKHCRFTTETIESTLLTARKHIPWVQANLIGTTHDDPAEVARFQRTLKAAGVWVSEPVPLFPFPGSPQYVQTFGAQPDEGAWERAHQFYLQLFGDRGFSDIQDQQPRSLAELECAL
ncbi:TIGR04295 family B12-binding domain-containing radical SAM protein [Occallatibacter riparius]|uniref:TIGR04295 family B12-binding domain-containing radical SAM protein n=1 Tax=Occallatibacter riparius TaxID=1002689 RepID=A0A9J7BWS8_9BACT|nr:TIGR04295 family B12-binding domain-containing radical SAM protein [Occallatibacter riparius]UWZ86945.1 TIGR04295 family B12-binding domain-containing radical SAM protein [Occallatibacter riparius]